MKQQNQAVSPSFSMRKFSWNLAGRERLGKVIQKSLSHNKRLNEAKGIQSSHKGWKPDTFRGLARVLNLRNHVTLRNLAAGSTANPNEEVLRAIAPHIYRVQQFDVENNRVVEVVLNYAKTYEGDWESLAKIGEHIASLDYQVVQPLQLTAEEAAFLLESIEQMQRVIPLLKRLAGDCKPRTLKQLQIVTQQEAREEFRRSFRAAVLEQGLTDHLPEQLTREANQTQVISRFFKLEAASVIAIYNGDRLPSVDEIDVLLDYLHKEDGAYYSQVELLDMIEAPPVEDNGGKRTHGRFRSSQ